MTYNLHPRRWESHGFDPLQAYGRKAHLLEDKKIPSVGVFDEVFLALGWHLEEIHVTWAHLEKKRTRLQLYTKYLEEPRIQSVETLLGGPASVDFNFSSELVIKRVAKTIVLMDSVVRIHDPQCELLLLRACAGISKLYFAMRTCSSWVFEMAQRSFDAALRSALERIVTASGPGFGDWQWRLSTLPLALGGGGGGLGAYLQLLGLSLMMLCMDLWQSQMEDHTSDWLKVVLIFVLGKTMNGKTYRCVLGYQLGVPLFLVPKPCSACSRVFTEDIYGDHAYRVSVLLALNIGITLYAIPLSTSALGSSPLTQTGMVDFVAGRAVTDATHRGCGGFTEADPEVLYDLRHWGSAAAHILIGLTFL
ncbi:hypothetical protein Tco_0686418 [Tanacetum coccineum]